MVTSSQSFHPHYKFWNCFENKIPCVWNIMIIHVILLQILLQIKEMWDDI